MRKSSQSDFAFLSFSAFLQKSSNFPDFPVRLQSTCARPNFTAVTSRQKSPDKSEGKIVRNQIDYILVRNYHQIFIQDSRSYAGTMSYSDHRLVMMKMKIDWRRKTPGKVNTKKYDIEKLKRPEFKEKYQNRVKEILSSIEANTEQERWDNIVHACHKASEEVLGKVKPRKIGKAVEDPEVKKLSEEQKKIRMDINATHDLKLRKELQKERNLKHREVVKKIKEIEEKRIEEDIEEIEKSKDDSTRMYKAIRKIQRNKPKDEIMVDGEEGMTSNDTEAAEIVTEFFKDFFNAANQAKFNEVPPTKMTTPFTEEE